MTTDHAEQAARQERLEKAGGNLPALEKIYNQLLRACN